MPPHTRSPVTSVALAVVSAGLIGECLFELYAWLASPVLFGFALQPSNLVIAMTTKLTGMTLSHAGAFGVHFLIGSLGFGAFVHLTRIALGLKAWQAGLFAGLVLWFVAQGVLAPFIGRSFMMGFGPYTQSSLVGHVGMTLVMAMLFEPLLARFQPAAAKENDDRPGVCPGQSSPFQRR